ncbi:MAG: penicillin-binding protein 2 [Acaryochloridaceae cyanobacterium RU_4_10]|nr:penicillin-binding protein 2 [Acaryochloridaceae cyanobacterium RU_4_10]
MSLLQPRNIQRSSRRISNQAIGQGPRSAVLVGLISLILFGLIPARLFFLQVVQGPRNRELADENRIQLIPKRPERGKIFDRKGRILASSQFSYSVFIWPLAQTKPQWPQSVQTLSTILKIPAKQIQEKVKQAGPNSPSLLRIARGISFAEIVALEEHRSELIGVEVDNEATRVYPNGELGAQTLGYIGEITGEELEKRKEQGYRLGDVIGKMGIEAAYENDLRGTWGGQQVEVDGSGRIVRILGQKPSLPGKDITLTIDLDVQKAAEKALGDRPGAVVALDPRDGAVRAMVSHPGFDPNWFSKNMTEGQWQDLQKRSFPFVNRAIQGFPPASTFKIITATAGMESGKFPPSSVLMTFPSIHGVGDWNGAGFGQIGFVTALQWSSNTFFGQVGVGVGPKILLDWAHRYGLEQKTGIEIPGEDEGFLPNPDWKKKVWQDSWYPADSVMVSIGQGAVQVSPLQSAVVFAVPANGGYRVKPHLKESAPLDAQYKPESLNIKAPTLQMLRTGMRAVVQAGTSTALNVPTIPPVAGKSGTGEDPPRRSHTWFGGFAPFDKPELVVVAFAENSGGGGGRTCGPIALQVFEAYFKNNPVKKAPPKS